jgi:hypothetical protein
VQTLTASRPQVRSPRLVKALSSLRQPQNLVQL